MTRFESGRGQANLYNPVLMRRVVPSQVVEFIDSVFGHVNTESADSSQTLHLVEEVRGSLLALVELVERIPGHLITVGSKKLAQLMVALEIIKTGVRGAESQEYLEATQRGARVLGPVKSSGGWNPIVLIRQALVECPDEVAGPATAELKFIGEPDLRQILRLDISTVDGALSNGEWKAATVLAGSVVEALLLWKLEQSSGTDRQTAIQNLLQTKRLHKQPSSDLENWNLGQYIEVASKLKLIADATANSCRLAKDFRNLIHPGRAKRLGQLCDRGTALSAVAAVEHVTEDLAKIEP